MSRFHTIVTALDFSDSASDALDAALAMATIDPGSRIHLLHVVASTVPALWTDELPAPHQPDLDRALVDAARAQLSTLAASRALDPASVTLAVVIGSAANEIVRYAEEQAADVVVVGSHGHGLVRRFLLGSVAEKIVRQASCAVLVVPHRALRSGAPASSDPAGLP